MKPLTALVLLCLVTPNLASASSTRYTIDWKAAETGTVHNGVTITLSRLGGTWWYSAPVGPVLGNTGGSDDARITFSNPVYEFCVHVGGQDPGEVVTVTTSQSSGNVYSKVDSGPATTTVSGNQFSWSGSDSPYTNESNRMCVANPSGFDWILYDHNGSSAGLVFNQGVYMDGSGCTPKTWYADGDGDGVGGSSSFSACAAPSGYVASTGDCDDTDAFSYPGALEVVGDEKDQSCDGAETCFADVDTDGWRSSSVIGSVDVDCDDLGEAASTVGLDCDDARSSVFPGASEVVGDGIDQSCDGKEACYVDGDRDGARSWGLVSSADLDCADDGEAAPSAPVDCDDDAALTYPGATEIIGDEVDQSCDGTELCYADADADRYRTSGTTASADVDCDDAGEAAATAGSDCDDTDSATFPGAYEVVGDEKDQSCDGQEICFVNGDSDGYRIDSTTTSADADCADAGEARADLLSGDCDDGSATVFPGAVEVPYDGIDQDCSGEDLCDVDEDGYDADAGACRGSDCVDEDEAIHPGGEDAWYDGVDADCDGASDYDADGDGLEAVAHGGTDCADDDASIYAGAAEIWYDDVDQNCDDRSDFDQDGDGFESSKFGGEDCDDVDATVYPGAPELADAVDNDCDTYTEVSDLDLDGIPDEDEQDLGLDPTRIDSDNDGTPDAVEIGSDLNNPKDSDGDGVIDAEDADDDGDGVPSAIERTNAFKVQDSDGDGKPDYLDTDSDGDGILDFTETDLDQDFDGIPTYLDDDSDEDGLPDQLEGAADSDGDGVADFIDPDDDGDGWLSVLEGSGDLDGDGTPNHLDADQDGDGKPDSEESLRDSDCDQRPDLLDDDDLDGPCKSLPSTSFEGASCDTAGSSWSALGLLIALAGLRRRRAA